MKTFIKNVLVSTALCILFITIVGGFLGAVYFKFTAIYQLFGINVLIHIILYLITYFDFEYWILEVMVSLLFLNLVTVTSWYLFDWKDYFSVLSIIVITVLVYLFAKIIDGIYLQKDVTYINERIKRRNIKNEE